MAEDFDPEEWLTRFVDAGCSVRVDAATMFPTEGIPVTPQCDAIWDEIKGDDNKAKWDAAEKLVRSKVGPIVGWSDYPKRR